MEIDVRGAERRIIDREGRGPGEFMNIHKIAAAGDSLWVHADRRTTLLGPEHEYVTSFIHPDLIFRLRAAPDGTLVFNGVARSSADLFGAILWTRAPDGTAGAPIIRKDDVDLRREESLVDSWIAFDVVGDTVVSVSRDRSELRSYLMRSGDPVRSTTLSTFGGAQPLELLVEGQRERCWVLYRTNPVPPAQREGSPEFRRMRDSLIALFDCVSGRLIGHYAGPEGFLYLLPGPLVSELVRDPVTDDLILVMSTLTVGE